MRALFRFEQAARHDAAVAAWLDGRPGPLGVIARQWFQALKGCGPDVEEVLHDGQPTACVAGAAFAYVDAFASHINLGFFQGSELPDPGGLLTGEGKFMRHIKLYPEAEVDATAMAALIEAAYADVKARLALE